MDENQYNSQIEKIASMLVNDNVSVDEQDVAKLKKYQEQIMIDCNLDAADSMKLVYEALLYLKLKNSSGVDPIQQGDQFGAGFS